MPSSSCTGSERLRGREGHSESDRAWRLRVTDVAAFAPVERMLRDAVGLLGLSIAHRRAREWLETKVIERGEELAERRAAIERHIAENARLAEIVRGADTARPDLAPQAAGLLAASLGLTACSAR